MPTVLRPLAGLLAAAALAFGALGCGGDDTSSTDAYITSMGRIQAQMVAAYQRLASQVTPVTTRDADAQTAAKLRDALNLTVSRLRAVDAPDKVRTQHQQLADALQAYRDDLASAADALDSGSGEDAAKARADLEKETTALSEAFSRTMTEINDRLHG